MRKKVLVAVVVALFAAPVFAELTIYGTADFGFEYIDLGLDPSGARVRVGRFTSGVLDPSVLGIKGEKDIDPDSKIGFQFETGFTFERGLFLDSGSNIDQLRIIPGATFGTLWNRMARIYLKTKFGEVSLGRQYSPISYVKCNLDPTCGGLGFSPDTYSEGTDRLDNSVKLTTNSIRGLVAQVSYSTGDQNMTNDDITVPEVPVNGSVAYGGSVQYTSGPVYFGAAYSSVNDSYTDYPRPGVPPAFKRPSNLVSYILGFSYSFPKVKPFVSFRRQTRYTYPTGSFYVPVSKNNVLSIGASMSSGRGTFVTNFSILTNKLGSQSSSPAPDKSNSRLFGLAYLYELRKDVVLYVSASKIMNGKLAHYSIGNASLPAPIVPLGNNPEEFVVGVRYNF